MVHETKSSKGVRDNKVRSKSQRIADELNFVKQMLQGKLVGESEKMDNKGI